ncbi:T9SS type A sorting domain-containing protein [Nafulsella turpanensis]|uniref:T9SS type A sorting domain-containing protein n=1 Tax=Nafulsella turpanensis TaxID=1265690 RepID=UPI00135F13E7|nr:PKD domain-containing protein [Nafulsella turpanensis]
MDFGSSLGGLPLSSTIVAENLFNGKEPVSIEVNQEGVDYYVMISTISGHLFRTKLGGNLRTSIGSAEDMSTLGTFGIGYNLTLVKEKGEWYGWLINDNNKELYRLTYKDETEVSSSYAYSKDPVSVKYSTPGKQLISLRVYDEEGDISVSLDSVQVNSSEAATVSIKTDNACIANVNTFTFQNHTPEKNITSYSWTFPDGSQQLSAEASYQFTEPGAYTVRLDIESENGCGKFFEKEITVYPEPQAAYSLSASKVCTNAAVAFTNETNYAADSVITYLWDFGDGTTSTAENPSHEYAAAGNYTVTLSAGIPGCTSVSTQSVTVEQGPQTLFAASPVCSGGAIVFDNQTSGTNITGYQWDLGDGTFSTLEDPQHIYQEPGEYTVVLKSKNSLGCETAYTQTVNVYSLPEPEFTTSALCAGTENRIAFSDASVDADGNIIDWQWAFEMPDGSILTSSARDTAISYPEAGSFEVSLSVATTWGCRETITKTLEVEPLPDVQIGFDGACEGAAGIIADITDTGGVPVLSRYWMVGDEVFADSAFSFSFPLAGTYEIFLQLNLANGCSATGTRQIVIAPLPEVDFDYYANCSGQTAVFESGYTSAAYRWSIDGVVQEGKQLQHLFPAEGSYTVELRLTDAAGCSNTISKTVQVGAPPVAAFTPDRLKGVAPFTVNFRNESVGATAFQWFFGDAQQSSSTEESPSFTFTETGDYEVRLIAFNADNCSDTTLQRISVVDPSFDVALNSLHTIRQGDQLQLVLDLENRGTIRVSEMDIEISVNNEYFFNEKLSDSLELGEQLNYPLNMQLIESSSRKFRFICVRLKPTLTLVEKELSEVNNEKCLNFDQLFMMQEPYPNPGSDEVRLSFVLPDEGGSVAVAIYSAQGGLVQETALNGLGAGLNEHLLDIRGLGKGIYYVRCRYGAEQHSYRFVKN